MAAEPLSQAPEPRPERRPLRTRPTARRRVLADRGARVLVTAGGLGIILSILGILAFIVIEIWPMTRGAKVETRAAAAVPGLDFVALVTDEYRSHAVGLEADGTLSVVRLDGGGIVAAEPLLGAVPAAGESAEPAADGAAPQDASAPPSAEPAPEPETGPEAEPETEVVAASAVPGEPVLTLATRDGRVAARRIVWEITFEGDRRVDTPRLQPPVVFAFEAGGSPPEVYTARLAEDGTGAAAAWLGAETGLALVRRTARENLLTGEVAESFETAPLESPEAPAVLILDRQQRHLYGGTASGRLLWWDLTAATTAPRAVAAGAPITALSLLIGDRALIAGQADGSLSAWFQVRQDDETFRLTRIRDFPAHPGAIERLSVSMRNKVFAAAGGGVLGLYHNTAHRTLWRGESPVERPRDVSLAPRGDEILLAGDGEIGRIGIYNPHPEVTLRSLFGKIWYEGYEKAEYVWQSTGGSDDFEPKLSLTPLLVGTLKGTFYSLLLAIPLAVLGAMYLSQFMHPVYQRYVKPTVEIMAALPTVVLGFLAGLWLAPRLERAFPSLLLMLVALPLLVLAAGAIWHAVPRRIRGRFATGFEALIFLVVLALGMWGCLALAPVLETVVFGGSFPAWLNQTTGMTYDQRNAVVVGLAMGFAVIPIIFAISEDAFSNVPRNLVSGALALGANRWQTVTRVVLPTASPGIFSAIMIGFGRAVGETMIVLMATGNTPIMDWSPFNGFRTLSANIAVEIPEAPIGGTLYRTLFLAALVLFALTFLVNTVAELVRQRLRNRYSQL
jgi:phosphate transport system permease protein